MGAARAPHDQRTAWAYIFGAIFVSGQVLEYAELIHEGVTLASDPYGSAFYMTTGFHALHVTGGLIAFLLIIGRSFTAKRYSHAQETGAVVTSYYWHFVDVVWIGLFITITTPVTMLLLARAAAADPGVVPALPEGSPVPPDRTAA